MTPGSRTALILALVATAEVWLDDGYGRLVGIWRLVARPRLLGTGAVIPECQLQQDVQYQDDDPVATVVAVF